MKWQLLFYKIWSIIGIFVLLGIAFFFVELYNHGSSWDGVFNAILKHIYKAQSDIVFGG